MVEILGSAMGLEHRVPSASAHCCVAASLRAQICQGMQMTTLFEEVAVALQDSLVHTKLKR